MIKYKNISLITSDTTSNEIKYNKNKLVVITTSKDKFGASSSVHTKKYDKNGNLVSEIHDMKNPNFVFGGVRTWSPFHHDKYRIDYKLDKYGNWISKYAVTWLRKYKVEDRIIEYK